MHQRLSVALLLLASFAGCSSAGPAKGSERAVCYGNQTCDTGLHCLSDVCVNASSVQSNPETTENNMNAEVLALRKEVEDLRTELARARAASQSPGQAPEEQPQEGSRALRDLYGQTSDAISSLARSSAKRALVVEFNNISYVRLVSAEPSEQATYAAQLKRLKRKAVALASD